MVRRKMDDLEFVPRFHCLENPSLSRFRSRLVVNVHTVTWQFCFGWKWFCFRCHKMYLSKLIHCRSGHCWPFQISNFSLSLLFLIACIVSHSKVKLSRPNVHSSGTKFFTYEISILLIVNRWVLGIKRLKL